MGLVRHWRPAVAHPPHRKQNPTSEVQRQAAARDGPLLLARRACRPARGFARRLPLRRRARQLPAGTYWSVCVTASSAPACSKERRQQKQDWFLKG
jgi:hypothetical protein